MEWFSKKTSIGHSTFQLDGRSGRHHCNLDHLHIHPLTRPPTEAAKTRAKTRCLGYFGSKKSRN